jgi:hypothetical protein
MGSVQFDGTEILNTTYMPQQVRHESVPDRFLNSLPLARGDGEVLISERYGAKSILLKGTLVGSSQSDLEGRIDAFKELFSRVEKNLDVSWNGTTRRYVATCAKHDFDRDFFHISMVPWTAEFVVLSGAGKDTAATTALGAANYVTVTAPGSDSFTLAGSKPPEPVITIDGSTDAPNSVVWPTGALGLQYKNTDTGEAIIVTNPGTWPGTTKKVVIDCALKKVTETITDGTERETSFYGVFPAFQIGTNNVEITVGSMVALETLEPNPLGGTFASTQIRDTTAWRAQAFQLPYADDTFQKITLLGYKVGAPGDLTVMIYDDNGGGPGSLVTGATATIANAAVNGTQTTPDYTTVTFAGPLSLSANTPYYIVVKGAATLDLSNYYGFVQGIGYLADGSASFTSSNSGSTWGAIDDYQIAFKLSYGGIGGAGKVAHSVAYTKTYL